MMNEDTTFKPEAQNRVAKSFQQKMAVESETAGQSVGNHTLQMEQDAVECPYCHTPNDTEAVFCTSCGKPLRTVVCPHCGNAIDAEADYCEVCTSYITTNICSYCGAPIDEHEVYCHECGNPRGGIVCPVCNTLNDFAFCKQCGTPLTDGAKALVAELKKQPDYQLLVQTAREMEELDMPIPYESERDVVRDQLNEQLRERVLTLLSKDKCVSNPVITKHDIKKLSKEELKRRKEEKQQVLMKLLDRMALPAMASPVTVRNYAMAQKPAGVRLAWVCNWKHVMHASPYGCGKPQLGGKWVVLGEKSGRSKMNEK